MKFIILMAGLLLAINIVNVAAMDTDDSTSEGAGDMTLVLDEDNSTAIDEDGEEPTDQYLQELNQYIEEQSQKPHARVARQGTAVVYQGNTIGLQSHVLYRWIGCPGTPCNGRTCPKMYMTGSDWTGCWGEVFRIYRQAGLGAVRVGDFVGIYYIRGGSWLGCPGSNCAKKTCPGAPNLFHGFSTKEKWFQCWGEVFRIYAYGKASGARINSGDFILLYYLNQKRWVSLGPSGNVHKKPCPGTVRPPSTAKYDACYWENFRLWKR